MRKLVLALSAALLFAACGGPSTSTAGGASAGGEVALLNVSYDPTRELYEDFNAAFSAQYKTADGKTVKVSMSHSGSGKQARAVIDGLDADVVTLALQGDIDIIAKQTQKIPADWRSKLPSNSSPYTSTIVFLVRKGNPKNIHDWGDLALPGVKVVTPNPKTSGGARWNYLAAWAWGMKKFNNDEAKVKDFIATVYKNAPVLDTGARGSLTSFAQRDIGDVLISWENEAFLALQENGPDKFEIVYPSMSILAEPPVAVVEGNAAKHGTQKVAEDYLKYLYSPAGQKIIAKHFYRPLTPADADPADVARLKPIDMVKIDDPMFGGWATVQPKHFDENGIFDQIYQPAK